jgi:hypothetical protein
VDSKKKRKCIFTPVMPEPGPSFSVGLEGSNLAQPSAFFTFFFVFAAPTVLGLMYIIVIVIFFLKAHKLQTVLLACTYLIYQQEGGSHEEG